MVAALLAAAGAGVLPAGLRPDPDAPGVPFDRETGDQQRHTDDARSPDRRTPARSRRTHRRLDRSRRLEPVHQLRRCPCGLANDAGLVCRAEGRAWQSEAAVARGDIPMQSATFTRDGHSGAGAGALERGEQPTPARQPVSHARARVCRVVTRSVPGDAGTHLWLPARDD